MIGLHFSRRCEGAPTQDFSGEARSPGGLRSIPASPRLPEASAVLTLGLGIVATTVMVSLLKGVVGLVERGEVGRVSHSSPVEP